MKRAFNALIIIIVCLVVVAVLGAAGFLLLYMPSVSVDLSDKKGEITSNASGYLYGIAQKGVPSENMTESIDISTVSQKVIGGLQHPIGDIDDVSSQLKNTTYNVVYLQDAYSTWYYNQTDIEKMRAQGKYDWKEFIEKDYFPRVKKAVKALSSKAYSDKVVYCLYNECDNGVWFGETKENDSEIGVYGDYNDVGSQNFFEAWKMTYDLVKSINPDALIGGPGFYEYNYDKLKSFLSYCKENDCVPDIMIYHELSDYSIYFWRFNVRDYRELEHQLGIKELPIIITEYGRMCDNGLPGKMVQYITQIELSKVYGDNAYWRLADNLCDVAADDNSPNSNWWLYRWYADMEGQAVAVKYQDLFRSNFENAVKKKAEYTSQGFMGVVSMTDDETKVEAVCGGRSGFASLILKNLDDTAMKGKNVLVTIEETQYKGLSGVVNKPRITRQYTTKIIAPLMYVYINNMDEANAYHIVVEVVPDDMKVNYENTDYTRRYEFERGDLLGNAYTYDSAYATTGELEGMVGGMEQEGDGVSTDFSVPADGDYTLDIIYGNANDGPADETGRQLPDGRTDATVIMSIDGEEQIVSFSNTIKSEYTNCFTHRLTLEKGVHTITFKHDTGTYVLDSMLVSKTDESREIAVLKDGDRTTDDSTAFLAVAPSNGYYTAANGESENIGETVKINGNDASSQGFYLMRGLNYLEFPKSDIDSVTVTALDYQSDITVSASDAELSGGAKLVESDLLDYIDGISSKGGEAVFSVKADSDGVYALTLNYANNDEGGVHAYNVDLIERYVTITVGSNSQDVFCRNTYSWDTYKTVTAYVKLKKGVNKISFTNSGSNSFNGNESFAPHIAGFTVNPISN